MAIKRPLCNYSGSIEELKATDSVPDVSGTAFLPYWKINSGESVSVGDRREYAINSGTFINAGTLTLGADAILFVGT